MYNTCAKPGRMHVLDKLFYGLSEKCVPLVSSLTPNGVTLASFATGLSATAFLCNGQRLAAAVSFVVSYWLDTLDGCTARVTDSVTEFGDMLDHVTDVIVWVLYMGMLVAKTDAAVRVPLLLGLLVLLSAAITHLACQHAMLQRMGGKPAPFMDSLRSFINIDPEEGMALTEWGSGGPAALIIAALTLVVPEKAF